MRNKVHFLLLTAGLCLIGCVAGFAQNQGATRGNLSVTVLDTSKAVVPGASVTITGPIGNQNETTSEQGTVAFAALVPGSYTVKVEKSGFAAVNVPNVQVLINNTAAVSVTLQTATVTEMIEVSATSVATIDTGSTSINSDLSDTLYNNIPIQRNVSSIIMLAPGAVSGLGTSQSLSPATTHTVVGSPASYSNPSISGASGLENLYVADGVVLNDPSYGGIGGFSTVYGPLGVGITPAFVKEEEVKTAGFEPQYGHATGGVIQIVTKSGSDHMHGTIGAYFELPGMQTPFLNKDDFPATNLLGRQLRNGEYEGDVELGGYVPHFKNHLYYFGAFDPTLFHDFEAPAVGYGLYTIYNGQVDRSTTTLAYAGKLTYRINDSMNVESSVFGDPSHMAPVPYSTLTANNTSGNSGFNYGTRNWDVRFYASITPTWTADFAFSYSWNHFTETPADTTVYPITDQTLISTTGQFNAQGLGTGLIVNYQSHAAALSFDTSKIVKFAGEHTFSLGYFWQYPTYDNITRYSTASYVIPGTNATGGDPGAVAASYAAAVGKMSDAALFLQLASNVLPAGTSCSLCPYMNLPGLGDQQVVLKQERGRYDGGISDNTGKYHAAYVNDSWKMSPHVTLNLGLRWEQQRLTGVSAANGTQNAVFNDQWSPRVGFVVSPNADSKIYVDWDRLAFILPLDMAVRELGGEEDDLNSYWAPASVLDPTSGKQMVTLDKYGTVNFVPDAAHLLNNATGGIPSGTTISATAGEPFVPGTKMEYNDEWVVGAEHKFHGGFTASARYINRNMMRVVEDMTGQSVEQIIATGGYNYFIGNPSANLAVFVTPDEITWQPTAAQVAAYSAATPVTQAAALGAPAGCFDSSGNPTPYMSGPVYDTFKTLRGAACFPSVNSSSYSTLNPMCTAGTPPTCPTGVTPWLPVSGDLYGGEYFGTGCPKDSSGHSLCKPGIYPNVARKYQAVEFEVNKNFSNNWQLNSNFRIGSLNGNYEGAFRNDNSQSDPGISSLFDLTTGQLGLLGQQLGIGPLNTDRKYVLNVEPSYVIPNGMVRGLVLGANLNVESGIPWTTLAAQQAYGNPGEVPIFGRGDLGRSPTVGTIDAHLEYPVRLGEGKQLKLQFDAFNIANTKRVIQTTQEVDLAFQQLNADFTNKIPLSFVPPFSSRAAIMFTF
jgi:carboxypeptidase family protein/TonB-dependent receptor-like protein